MLDKLISYILGVKKSNFQISEKELEKISAKSLDENNNIDVDTTVLFKDSFESLSETIFTEATQKYKVNRYNYWAPKYSSLDSYKFLSEQKTSFKRDFAYWIVDKLVNFIKHHRMLQKDLEGHYLQEILRLLLQSNLHFKEKDFIYFMNFWKDYPAYITLGSLTSRLRQKAQKKGISDEMYEYLKKFLKHPRFHNEFYNYYKTPRNTLQKILHNHSVNKDEK
ncbi:hypothetical protein [Aquimarina sp. SS2-1]|uniref:hypothetical protein n=1 Tax=Aquimarina besae TaxID=3342247 RepID=UPI00367000AC